MPGNKKLFLSAVSREFLACRELLAGDLKRPALDVAVQEDFLVTGGSTLAKLDDYIRACDGIIHLVGKAAGAVPEEAAVAALLRRHPDLPNRLSPLAPALAKSQPGFSYTQWEAYLAMYHDRPLFVYRPTDFESDALHVPRDPRFVLDPVEVLSQREHYQRISAFGHDRGQFLNEERLSSAVLRDLVEILPRLQPSIAVAPTRLRHTAARLIGRDEDLARLDAAWNGDRNVVIVRAFGGMGKTSLVATWMAELAMKNWRGAERVFDWSFYSQGTNHKRNASADIFIANALEAFGDPDSTLGSAWERGARLAGLVGKVRCLLVLDGLEPLQYPPGPMHGKLKDAGIEALLKGLSAQNAGLCVVTTRERVPDIEQHYGRKADDFELTELTDLAGAALLHDRGATRAGAREIAPDDQELRAASREVHGHGLTLQLLGQYLRLVEGGDIRKRDTVRLADADREYKNDATRPYGHAFKAMEAYENWFQREGEQGQLAVLRLLGLFDRPASKSCLDALRKEPVIAGLTEPLVGMSLRDWAAVMRRLEEIHLLTVQADGALDAHPLLREYFGQRLRAMQPEAWRAAHRRLYEHLCATTKDKPDATLEDLQPLYQAVAHGCYAGLQQEAFDSVYYKRLQRGNEHYPHKRLGAVGTDLGCLSAFFSNLWTDVSDEVPVEIAIKVLDSASESLHSMGRLLEAQQAMKSLHSLTALHNRHSESTIAAILLSEVSASLGQLNDAVDYAEEAIARKPRSFHRKMGHVALGVGFHQKGEYSLAANAFQHAERIEARRSDGYQYLRSLQGYWFCEFLLEIAARRMDLVERQKLLAEIETRAEICLASAKAIRNHLAIGLAQLTKAQLSIANARVDDSVGISVCIAELRHAGDVRFVSRGLLTRAWLRGLTGPRTGTESAQSDLDEGWEIAQRGPMPLFQADIHLYRARLFFREANYPWESPQHDLAEARRLIFEHGYLRRKEELEDAEELILGKH